MYIYESHNLFLGDIFGEFAETEMKYILTILDDDTRISL